MIDEKGQMSLREIKTQLRGIIEEWVGYDTPEVGDEDFDTLQSMEAELDSINCLADVVGFLEGCGIDSRDWFESCELQYPSNASGNAAKSAAKISKD